MQKRKLIIILLVVFILLISFVIYFLYALNIIPHRKYTNKDFSIETYISLVDKDNDGIDDQTDIINNTRKYIKTKPKYRRKY